MYFYPNNRAKKVCDEINYDCLQVQDHFSMSFGSFYLFIFWKKRIKNCREGNGLLTTSPTQRHKSIDAVLRCCGSFAQDSDRI